MYKQKPQQQSNDSGESKEILELKAKIEMMEKEKQDEDENKFRRLAESNEKKTAEVDD